MAFYKKSRNQIQKPEYNTSLVNEFVEMNNPTKKQNVNLRGGDLDYTSIFCSSNGKYIALTSGIYEQRITVYDVENNKQIYFCQFLHYVDQQSHCYHYENQLIWVAVHITNDLKYLIIGGFDLGFVYSLHNMKYLYEIKIGFLATRFVRKIYADFNEFLYIAYSEPYKNNRLEFLPSYPGEKQKYYQVDSVYSNLALVNLSNGQTLYNITLYKLDGIYEIFLARLHIETNILPVGSNYFYSNAFTISEYNIGEDQIKFLPGYLRQRNSFKVLKRTPQYQSIKNSFGITIVNEGQLINLYNLQQNKLLKKISIQNYGLKLNYKAKIILLDKNMIIQLRYREFCHLIQKILVFSQKEECREFSNDFWLSKSQMYTVAEELSSLVFLEY